MELFFVVCIPLFLLLSFRNNIFYPVAAMMKSGKIYYLICIKWTGEQVSMVTKPLIPELFVHSEFAYRGIILAYSGTIRFDGSLV